MQPAFHGLELDQKNIDLNESFIGAQKNLHDILTGTSDGNFLRRKKTRSTNHSTRTSQQQPDIENRDLNLAQTVARLERQQDVNYCLTIKMPDSLTSKFSTFDGKTDKFEELFNKSLKMYPHLTEGKN